MAKIKILWTSKLRIFAERFVKQVSDSLPLCFFVCVLTFTRDLSTLEKHVRSKSKRPKIFTRSFAQATWNVNNMHRLRTRAKATRRNKIKHKTFYFEIRTRDSLCVGRSGEGWMSQRRYDFFSGFVDVGVFTHKTREAHFRNSYASSPNFRLDLLHPIQCE